MDVLYSVSLKHITTYLGIMAVHEMHRPIGGVLDRRPSPLWLGGSDIEARLANIDAGTHYTKILDNFVT